MISNLTNDQFGNDSVRPLRVFVADENQGVLRVLHNLMRFLGHVVVGTAVDGHECVRRVMQLRPDLVIADLTMPRCDGISVAAAISRISHIPVIITTGATDEDTLERIASADIAGHLAKPFKLDEVKAAIDAVTNRQSDLVMSGET